MQLDLPEAQKIQIFVKERQRLRVLVLLLGPFEALHNLVPLLEDCYTPCGTRLLLLSCTAIDESLNGGCTIHVFRRLRGGVPVQVEIELNFFLGNGNVWNAGPTDAGLQVSVAFNVLHPGTPSSIPLQVVLQHMSLWWFLVVVPPLWSLVVLLLPLVPPSSLGWCLVPSVRPLPQRAARVLRQPERLGSLLSCAWLQAPSSWCWCWF